MDILGLTFDDVPLQPGESDVLPSQADTRTRISRELSLNIPIVALSAMDTVTKAAMAIVMAQLGGIGVLHRNLSLEDRGGGGDGGQALRIGDGGQPDHHRRPRRSATPAR